MRVRIRAEARSAVLSENEVVIGRSAYCSLVLDHSTVSRLHAVFRSVDGRVQLDDLGSSNGTFVNGARIAKPTEVKPGDEIRIGSQPLSLELVPSRTVMETGRLVNHEGDPTMVKAEPGPES